MSAEEHLGPQFHEAYRIFRIGKNDEPHVLFHPFDKPGGERSRRVPMDVTHQAEEKQAWNPGKSEGPGYTSGWHSIPTREEAEGYLKGFKDPSQMRVSKVHISEPRMKPRSRARVQLSSQMHVRSEDWKQALGEAP